MEIGVICDDLSMSQEAFMLLSEIANISKKIDHQVIIFQKNITPPCLVPMCAVMNIAEIYSFRGLLIVTNLENLRLAVNTCKQVKDIIYYPMDLEWIRREKNFISNIQYMRKCKIITQNEYHALSIFKYSNIKVDIVRNFNINTIASKYVEQN